MIAVTCHGADKVARPAQRRTGLQNVGSLRQIDCRGDIQRISQIPPIAHHALQVCLRNRRA